MITIAGSESISSFEPIQPRLLQPVAPGSYDGPPPYTKEIANSGRGGTDRREVRQENRADNRIDRRYTRQQVRINQQENRQKNMASFADRTANLPVTQNIALRAGYRFDNVQNRFGNVQNNVQNGVGARYDNSIGQRVAETQYRQDMRQSEVQYRQDARQGARAQRFDARNARFSEGVSYQREPILNRPIFNARGGGVRSEISTNGPASDAVRSADVKAAVSGRLRGTSSSNNALRHDTNVNVRYENDLRNTRSRIMDAGFAEESRAQILRQPGIASLAQANMSPQAALSLIQS